MCLLASTVTVTGKLAVSGGTLDAAARATGVRADAGASPDAAAATTPPPARAMGAKTIATPKANILGRIRALVTHAQRFAQNTLKRLRIEDVRASSHDSRFELTRASTPVATNSTSRSVPVISITVYERRYDAPFTSRIAPVRLPGASSAQKVTTSATSSGVATRPSG